MKLSNPVLAATLSLMLSCCIESPVLAKPIPDGISPSRAFEVSAAETNPADDFIYEEGEDRNVIGSLDELPVVVDLSDAIDYPIRKTFKPSIIDDQADIAQPREPSWALAAAWKILSIWAMALAALLIVIVVSDELQKDYDND